MCIIWVWLNVNVNGYCRLGNFHVKNNLRKKFLCLINFRGFIPSVKFLSAKFF